MILIDTNIFIELLLDQEKSSQCQKFLAKASRGEIKCVVTSFTVHAVEGLLTQKSKKIENFLKNIEKSTGIQVIQTEIGREREISKIAQESELDFDDSLQLSTARRTGAEKIVSFDSDFDNKDVERVTPSQVIEDQA